MRVHLPVVLALLLGSSALGQTGTVEPSPVEHYTRRTSFSLLSGASLLGGVGTNGVIGVVGAGDLIQLSLAIDARLSIFGFLVDLSLTGALGTSASAVGNSSPVAIVPGIALGYAIGLSPRVALSPMVRGVFYFQLGAGSPNPLVTTVQAELPVTIFLGRNGFMEPYLAAGFVLIGRFAFAGSIGYRLGVTF